MIVLFISIHFLKVYMYLYIPIYTSIHVHYKQTHIKYVHILQIRIYIIFSINYSIKGYHLSLMSLYP